jgi:hypothetical protein
MTFTIERLRDDRDLDGVLAVEDESFNNPWTRDMYNWELQNRAVCHIYLARTPDGEVAGFCAFWLVYDEIHITKVAQNDGNTRSLLAVTCDNPEVPSGAGNLAYRAADLILKGIDIDQPVKIHIQKKT